MAADSTKAGALNPKEEKKRLQTEKKGLKQDQKKNRNEAKKRAKEIAAQERRLEKEAEGSGFSVFVVTLFVIVVWLGVILVLIKLDIGGFGSQVLSPLLKDVPSVSWILPKASQTEGDSAQDGIYYGYSDLKEAVEQIKTLELELAQSQSTNIAYADEITVLKAEVERLAEYEKKYADFEKEKTLFAQQVVFAENGPGIEEYASYYESMDPATAEYLYKQVVAQIEEDATFNEYAQTYAQMKPKEAAALFEAMDSDLGVVVRILEALASDSRAAILDAMDKEIAAQITKLMDPQS